MVYIPPGDFMMGSSELDIDKELSIAKVNKRGDIYNKDVYSGSWFYGGGDLRSTDCGGFSPSIRNVGVGFRGVARTSIL